MSHCNLVCRVASCPQMYALAECGGIRDLYLGTRSCNIAIKPLFIFELAKGHAVVMILQCGGRATNML
jgi:hypothetical protein